ncbi:TetR/AcrR family transcriptional regulator [Pedobacter sp. SL55]|uniref:TetR/AcrR family transcriptional regulator n=1 Tax=Pedobacter sp. SL55 TaxID=2995161 RepID=UPI0022707C35|nr:TetR/AcrR family transcriptional regulator [Pedobacter sp. SL55]WAC41184.1 TetR/AcrR family transcriptional regulator [Pedobacter sp. SL55]
MGRKEKDRKQIEDVRLKILEAAKDLFLKHGFEATSIRKIAAEINLSPTTIYLYYKDKGDIAYTLHKEGFKLLGQQFVVLQHVSSGFERLKAMGKVYLNFAMQNTDFYQLMFIMREPMDFVADKLSCEWEEGELAFGALQQTVLDCKSEGYFKDLNENNVALNVWALVHGLCSLKLQGHLDHVASAHLHVAQDRDLLEEAFETFVMMLEKMK